MMGAYITILLYIGLAELTRRICLSIIGAYTGPLSKVPGPFLNKFTAITWTYHNVKGTMMYLPHGWFQKYGDVIRIGPNEVLVASRDDVQKVLIDDDLIKAPVYDMAKPEGTIATLISERDRVLYRKKRRQLSPGFSISYINGLEPLMRDCIKVFEETLDARCAEAGGSAIIDMFLILGNLTSDVMSATSFGGSMNLVATGDTYFRPLFMKRTLRVVLDAQFPFLKYLPFGPKQTLADLDTMIDNIITKRRAEKGPPKKDLVQIFIEVNDAEPESFTQKHLREEMVLFMIAGSDTTSVTATFTLLLLVNNLEKLRKLEEELKTAFPSKQDPCTFANTQDLPYLNAVIKESMRVMPIVVGSLTRWTTQSTMLGGYEIPPETAVGACIPRTLHDPRIWPDPEDFIPERWLGKYKGVEADRKAYHPFSAGTHSCIGQQFALKELRLILATLVRKYELSLVPGQSHELRVHVVPYFLQGFYNVGVKPKTD